MNRGQEDKIIKHTHGGYMLEAKTEEQKKKVLEIFEIPDIWCHFPLDFDKKTDWGYEEFNDRIYLDGNITFDQMAAIVDYLREQNNNNDRHKNTHLKI